MTRCHLQCQKQHVLLIKMLFSKVDKPFLIGYRVPMPYLPIIEFMTAAYCAFQSPPITTTSYSVAMLFAVKVPHRTYHSRGHLCIKLENILLMIEILQEFSFKTGIGHVVVYGFFTQSKWRFTPVLYIYVPPGLEYHERQRTTSRKAELLGG